jgi:hypothetical protein
MNSISSKYYVTYYRPCWIDMSWSGVVDIMTRLQAERFRVRNPVGARDFLFSKISRPALGPTQPPVQWILGFFPGAEA